VDEDMMAPNDKPTRQNAQQLHTKSREKKAQDKKRRQTLEIQTGRTKMLQCPLEARPSLQTKNQQRTTQDAAQIKLKR
jgi:hypothetical protein